MAILQGNPLLAQEVHLLQADPLQGKVGQHMTQGGLSPLNEAEPMVQHEPLAIQHQGDDEPTLVMAWLGHLPLYQVGQPQEA